MKMTSDVLKIVTHEDAETARKSPARAGELNLGINADPANLMELLVDIDGLKQEIHDRMRRIEAVKQARSVLLEDAERTEALNRRMAEIGKAMSSAQPGLQAAGADHGDGGMLRVPAREPSSDTELRHATRKVLNEGAALPWPRTEEPEDSSEDDSIARPPQSLEAPIASPDQAQTVEEANIAIESALKRLEEVEQSRELARLEAWKKTDETAQEAKRSLDEAICQLNRAIHREERATSEFLAAQQTLTTAYQSANARMEEAEQCWRLTDQATHEAKSLLEQSASELVQARKKEESVAANLQSVRQEFTAAYQSASQRLEEAERFWQKGDNAAQQAQHLIDQSTAELLQARKAEETAAADLLSARQELTTAYQFAAVAAQRRLDAADSFQKVARWTIFATVLSWIAMAWLAWLSFRMTVPIWCPCAATVILVLLAFVFAGRGTREA